MNLITCVNKTMPGLCLAVILCCAGCATSQVDRMAEADRQFKAQEYILPLHIQESSGPVLEFRVGSVQIKGKDMQVRAESLRALEIRTSITNFVGALARELPNHSNPGPGEEPLRFLLTFDGEENIHAGSSAAKAFATGFFTLGLVGHIAPGVYSYRSMVRLEASSGGKTAVYSAESQELTVKYNQNVANAGAQAASTARRQADDESLQQIARLLVQEGFFQ
jgi:hypothetical protein